MSARAGYSLAARAARPDNAQVHNDTKRTVTAVVTCRGTVLGSVGPFGVDSPHWAEVGQVARELTERLAVPVMVLRLLSVDGGDGGRGGLVTYHAEALDRPEAELAPAGPDFAAEPADHPLRLAWATPEGLRSALDWASSELDRLGRPATGPAEQVKSWNLSGLFRIPTADGPVWLKTTPPFGVDEAGAIAVFGAADPALVPGVLAAAPHRVLLEHVAGVDCWGAPEDGMLTLVERLAEAQHALAGRRDPALADRTPAALVGAFRELLASGKVTELSPEELADAGRLADRLPGLVEELARCGLPETAVHGDFHPGNWRFDGERAVAMDFSDAFHGHPAFDGHRPRPFLGEERWAETRGRWVAAWRRLVPGADPERALELSKPLMHVYYAVRYQEFLDGIEPSERIYHAGDPAAEIRRALASAGAVQA
ncbi:hypothetical protein GCM10010441_76220 [Kitasatospora paracochleata]